MIKTKRLRWMEPHPAHDEAPKVLDGIDTLLDEAIGRARELGWYEGVEAEKARARKNKSNPAEAAPGSFINLAFDSGRVFERHKIEAALTDLQADTPIDGPAYKILEKALAAIKKADDK